jgi:hypothetical protein
MSTGPKSLRDVNPDAGTDTDTDTGEINPSKKGTVPFLKGLILRHGALANSDLSSLVLGLGWGRTWVRPQPNPRSR